MNEYTALIKKDGDWWIGRIEEVPGANCQEASRDKLSEILKITNAKRWSSTGETL